ncbi:MAG: D-alanyl-D-alanine carboxypeptidase family protein [Alicyclobacillaceae bacterium]|nr:D-alanyl-D-alanine carboxypeptidase family protein [Alicyclobacillaceae bacterium]
MVRKLVLWLWMVAVVVSSFPAGVRASRAEGPAAVPAPPDIAARGAAVVDVDSGRVLYAKEGDRILPIASLTKIVTGWIAVESGRLDEWVTVSPRAAGKEGSSVYLKAGERYKLRDLVYAMMLRSGNDAAVAVAEHLSGSEEKFAELMNRKVRELGLRNMYFANPHGLDAPGHGASPADLARLTARALKNPEFAKIVSTRYYRMPWPGEPWDRSLRNKNKMLWQYPGADGVKTGYTKKAGRCLASSATRDGRRVVAVVLDDPSDWKDSARLLDYAFRAYRWIPVPGETSVSVRKGRAESIRVTVDGPRRFPVRGDEFLSARFRLPSSVRAPVSRGDRLGELEVTVGDEAYRYPAVALEAAVRRPWWDPLGWLG